MVMYNQRSSGKVKSIMEIPGYKILQKIGKGGMSVVYLAIQESLQRRVALKILSPTLAKEKEFCQQLLEEGKTIASLDYLNIVTVYDVGSHAGNYYLSMEYVNGGCLRQKMDSGQLDEVEAVDIARTLTKTLAYAHHRGVLHKDIKPRNILFRENGDLVLTDFGIARSIEDEDDHKNTGFTLGSPRYMSPEQIRGNGVDKRSDYYSLGVILYEMLANAVPYDASTALEIARKQLSSPIPELPEEKQHFQPMINRLLAKKPEGRFKNTSDILQELNWLAGSGHRRKSDRIQLTKTEAPADQIEKTQRLSNEKIREFLATEDLEIKNIPSDTLIDINGQDGESDEATDVITKNIFSLPVEDVDIGTIAESSVDPINLRVNPNDRNQAIFLPEEESSNKSLKWFFLPAVTVVLAGYFLLVKFTPYLNQQDQIQSAPDGVVETRKNEAMTPENNVHSSVQNPIETENHANTTINNNLSSKGVNDEQSNEVIAPVIDDGQQFVEAISVSSIPPANTTEISDTENTDINDIKPITTSDFGMVERKNIQPPMQNKTEPDQQSHLENKAQEAEQDTADDQPVFALQPQKQELASINYTQEELMDNGVSLSGGGKFIISAELEARVRRYFSQVERLPAGQVRIVLNQQDLYEEDSPVLDIAAKNYLEKLGFVLRNYSGFSINVIDRSKQNGTLFARNLSWGRARMVSKYLVSGGISQSRVHHRGNNQGGNLTDAGIELLLVPIVDTTKTVN